MTLIGSSQDLTAKALEIISFKKTIFISDENIWQNCQKFFPKDFQNNFVEFLLLKTPKADEKNLKIIENKLQNVDFILCLGSGTINDLCKLSAANKNIPYAVFASAASMNGYLSKNASITINGHKKTLAATLPDKVFCSLDILKDSPQRLTKAGIGDSLCFYSCYFDWYLSHKILGTEFDQKPFEILREKMDFFLNNYQKFSLENEGFLELLVEILLLSGLGMTMAKGSYPASQSEHMIAHTIDMKYPEKFAKVLHGQAIAVTTLTTSKIQSELLLSQKKDLEILSGDEIYQFFPEKIASECLREYQSKLQLIKRAKKLDSKTIKELQKIHLDEAVLRKILTHFEIDDSAESLGLSNEEYEKCTLMAKFTRNRFTCLDFICA